MNQLAHSEQPVCGANRLVLFGWHYHTWHSLRPFYAIPTNKLHFVRVSLVEKSLWSTAFIMCKN